MRFITAIVVTALAIGGCTQVDPGAEFTRSRDLIEQTTSYRGAFDPDQPPMSTADIDAVLAGGLSLDDAVRLALVNNRKLQSQFMRIGVAKADWVQAGLLSNPSLEAAVMIPIGGGRSDVQASLAQNLVQLLRIPAKRRIAQHQLDEAVLTFARQAGELVAEVRTAYYDAVAAEESLRVSRESLGVVGQSLDTVVRQRQAGVSSAVDENLGRGQALAAELAQRNARLEAATARRKLAGLLSLDRDLADVKLTTTLAAPPLPANAEVDPLITVARDHRLDLQAARANAEAAAATLAFEKGKTFPDINAGASMERMQRRGGDAPDIDVMTGPMVSLEIPIFDQNQAQIARARYLHFQAVKTYEEMTIAVSQEVRTAFDTARTATENVQFYREKLLPQAEEGFRITRDSYAAGRSNLLSLLESQRLLLESRRDYIRVQREAATARAALDRAVGQVVPP